VQTTVVPVSVPTLVYLSNVYIFRGVSAVASVHSNFNVNDTVNGEKSLILIGVTTIISDLIPVIPNYSGAKLTIYIYPFSEYVLSHETVILFYTPGTAILNLLRFAAENVTKLYG